MDLLGDNLESYLYINNGSLSLSYVLKIAIKMIHIIQQIHFRYLLHRDIKPRNIVLPYKNIDENYTLNDMSQIYLIDFGLSKFYVTSNLTTFSNVPGHIPFNDHHIHTNITGTSRFASLSVLTGYGKWFYFIISVHFFSLKIKLKLIFIQIDIIIIEASRRDDLESLGYTLIHLLKANKGLWNQEPQYYQNVYESMSYDVATTRWKMFQIKATTSISELCEGLPGKFSSFILN